MGSDTAREVAHKFIADGSDWCHFRAATGHSAACDRLTLRIEMAYGTDDENDKSLAEVNATLESERSRTAALEGALDALADVAEEALTTERELIRRWMEANSAELRRRVEAARRALTPEPLATTKGTP